MIVDLEAIRQLAVENDPGIDITLEVRHKSYWLNVGIVEFGIVRSQRLDPDAWRGRDPAEVMAVLREMIQHCLHLKHQKELAQ